MQDIDDTIKNLMEKAKTNLLNDGHLVPVALITVHEGDSIVFPMLYGMPKNIHQQLVRRIAKQVNATAIFLIHESYFDQREPGQDLPTESLADSPTTRSCISVCGRDKNNHVSYVTPYTQHGGQIFFEETIRLEAYSSKWTDGVFETAH